MPAINNAVVSIGMISPATANCVNILLNPPKGRGKGVDGPSYPQIPRLYGNAPVKRPKLSGCIPLPTISSVQANTPAAGITEPAPLNDTVGAAPEPYVIKTVPEVAEISAGTPALVSSHLFNPRGAVAPIGGRQGAGEINAGNASVARPDSNITTFILVTGYKTGAMVIVVDPPTTGIEGDDDTPGIGSAAAIGIIEIISALITPNRIVLFLILDVSLLLNFIISYHNKIYLKDLRNYASSLKTR